MLSLAGKQRDQGSSMPHSKQIKKHQSQLHSMLCNKLQTLCDKLKEKDMVMLMGDLNAKIGSDNSGYEQVIGRQGLGKLNENGDMLADLCAFYNMIIGGSEMARN